MSYTPLTWNLNAEPPINSDNLNHIEQGIFDAHNAIASLQAVTYTTVTDNGWTIKKFADGTYEGHKTETRSIPITTAWGSMWRSLDQTVTAPALSTSIDFYTVDCNYPGTFCTVSSFYTLNWTAFSSTSETATRDVRYYIRGRWD